MIAKMIINNNNKPTIIVIMIPEEVALTPIMIIRIIMIRMVVYVYDNSIENDDSNKNHESNILRNNININIIRT